MTIAGANDAPDIMVESGNSDSAALALTKSSDNVGNTPEPFTTGGGTAVTTGTLSSPTRISDADYATVTGASATCGVAPPQAPCRTLRRC